ncbi:MAG: putative peroxiredoxin [Planctomycetota bacterium]
MRGYPAAMRIALAALLAAQLLAQEDKAANNTFGHSRHGAEFNEGPRQAAYLMAGMSPQVHFPVQGIGEEAQDFFDQGLCQQHGFWYFEAERSFRQVALRHPDCAMAYLGMCWANVENHARGAGFAAQAVQRAEGASATERMWIDAWARYHDISKDDAKELQSGDAARIEAARKAIVERSKSHDDKARGRDLVRDLEQLIAERPDDVEAKAFLVVQIWRNSDSGLEITSHGAVEALLQQALAAAPLHPAHHFRVHLWDHEKAERAVVSAATLGSTAPGIAHQWHMGGHIFDKLGRWTDAAWQQEASSRVDHAHMHRDRVMPYEIHNYGHNQEWLCRSLSACGRTHDAIALASNMIALPRHPKHNRVEADEEIAGFGRVRLLEIAEQWEMWPEIEAACADGRIEATDDPKEQTRRLLALGVARFRSNQQADGDETVAQLRAHLDGLRNARAKAIDEAEAGVDSRNGNETEREKAIADAIAAHKDRIRNAMDALHRLAGERALALGDGKAALEEFERASGTPAWAKALAEIQSGEPKKAVERLRTAMGEHPKAHTLARLVVALKEAGEEEELQRRFEELRKLAGHADLDAPLLQRIAPIAAAACEAADWRLPQAPGTDVGVRPQLDDLGPFRWAPQAAPEFDLERTDGAHATRATCLGKRTLLVFYLGFSCAHCVEQLKAFGPKAAAFAEQGIDVIAIGNQDLATVRELQASMDDEQRIALPLFADPSLAAFRAFRAYDDFEQMPLHSVVLLDEQGTIRWQDIGAEPFVDVDWLLRESTRLLELPASAPTR